MHTVITECDPVMHFSQREIFKLKQSVKVLTKINSDFTLTQNITTFMPYISARILTENFISKCFYLRL